MFELNNKQYIFKLSTGQVINIFYKSGNGLCVRSLANFNNWSEPSILLEDALPDFCAFMDEMDTIHILSQTKNFGLLYTYLSGGEWKSRAFKNNETEKQIYKFLSIVSMEGKVFFFYLLEEADKKTLLYQISDRPNYVTDPQMIDWVRNGRRLPFRLLEHLSTLYIFYNHVNGKSQQIVCKNYDESSQNWTTFDTIDVNEDNAEIRIISVMSDIHNNIHLCWQKTTANKCELIYSKKALYSDIWVKHTLTSTAFDFYNCSILAIYNRIIIYWVRDKNIYYCLSEDSGNTWSSPRKYLFPNSKPIYCIKYMQNPPCSQNGTFMNELPGIYYDGYQLGFIDEFSYEKETAIVDQNREGDDDMNDFQLYMANSLKTISGNLDELKKSMERLQEKLAELELIQKQSEPAFKDYSSNQKILQQDICSVKSDLKQLKDTIELLKNEKNERIEPVELINDTTKKQIKPHVQIPVMATQTVNTTSTTQIKQNEPQAPKIKTMMPGVGFSDVTPDFLRNLGKK